MHISYECSELIKEIKEDLEEFGNGPAVAIFEMKTFRQPLSDAPSFFKALVSYDTMPEDIETLKSEKCYQGCSFEVMPLADILKLAEHQNNPLS